MLEPLPQLLSGAGSVGYSLSLRPSAPVAHLDWNVTTTLSSVDRRGRFPEKMKRVRRHLSKVSKTQDVGIRFRVGGKTAFYRVVVVFRDDAGRKLGRYGFYFRVVPVSDSIRLVLDGSAYRPGEAVFGRIDNLGSETVFYGAPFAIERPEGAAWGLAPESHRGPWILPLYSTRAGQAGRACSIFRIPQEMPPGRYRMSKRASVGSFRPSENQLFLAAEFTVLP